MTKYATLRQYQPYIDVIRKDLGIPDTMIIDFQFVTWNGPRMDVRDGDATYYHDKYSRIRIRKTLSKNKIISVLMHELRHIWQHINGKMQRIYKVKTIKNRETTVTMKLWDGVEYMDYSNKTRTHYNKYFQSPWEIDAREYALHQFKLFPGSKLPETRKLVGVVGKIKFYKISA